MFTSPEPYSDLIFQDATQQLAPIDSSLRRYYLWLGENFMRARRLVDCRAAGSKLLPIGIVTLLISVLYTQMLF